MKSIISSGCMCTTSLNLERVKNVPSHLKISLYLEILNSGINRLLDVRYLNLLLDISFSSKRYQGRAAGEERGYK